MKPTRKKQRLVNSSLKETFQKEMRDFLRAELFFLVFPGWVSNSEPTSNTTDNIRTYISLRTFRQAIMGNLLPLLSMKMFMQQVVESKWEPLLDSLFGYSKIKIKRENFHKTTLISFETMFYNYLPFGLFYASTSFKRPIHTVFNELVILHAYLDDLIICVEGLIITLEFQVLGHF